MSLPGTGGALPQHSDVLSAVPADAEDTKKLVEELRRRGNAAFKTGSFFEAESLYAKAIEHDGKDAALFGNRAAARIGMKKFSEAISDAEQAIKLGWTKGHFRRGQALAGMGKWREAQNAYEMCASLDEKNSDAKKEAEKARIKADEADDAMDVVVEDTSSKKPAAEEGSNRAKIPAAKPRKEKTHTPKDDDVDADLDASKMRGYKKLEDGRTTTYFHREIDPEEKKRLAEANKPKALMSTTEAPASNSKDGSVWNSAGTFEERDMTNWAKDKLKELIKGVSTVFEGTNDSSGIVEAVNVTDIDGVASVSFIRGTRRYPFDFTFNIDWTATIAEGEFNGKLFFSQFTSEDDDYDSEIKWDNREKAGKSAKSLQDHIKGEFRKEIEKKLKFFVEEFRKL